MPQSPVHYRLLIPSPLLSRRITKISAIYRQRSPGFHITSPLGPFRLPGRCADTIMSERNHKAPCNRALDQVIKNQISQDMHMTELKPFYPDRPADCDRPLCLSQKHQSNWLLAIKRATGVTQRPSRCTVITYLLVLTCVTAIHNSLWPADPALQQAYIGPGAGIALVGSFLAVSMAILSAVGAMMIWPIRRLWRAIRGRRRSEDVV